MRELGGVRAVGVGQPDLVPLARSPGLEGDAPPVRGEARGVVRKGGDQDRLRRVGQARTDGCRRRSSMWLNASRSSGRRCGGPDGALGRQLHPFGRPGHPRLRHATGGHGPRRLARCCRGSSAPSRLQARPAIPPECRVSAGPVPSARNRGRAPRPVRHKAGTSGRRRTRTRGGDRPARRLDRLSKPGSSGAVIARVSPSRSEIKLMPRAPAAVSVGSALRRKASHCPSGDHAICERAAGTSLSLRSAPPRGEMT